MAKAKHTYAIRLSVDGGGKVKAELMDVGRAGDKSLKKIEKAGGRASLGLTKLSDRAQSLGRNMKFLYGAIAAAGAIRGLQEMVKLYADFEAGLIGVGKTANLSKTELAALGQDIDALSKRIPVATDELLAIAQSAGQLGVKGAANILKFTETVAKLGTATDLSGNDAAMALARILNVTGEAMGTVDVLGSVIVALGNNFAATESQIADMAELEGLSVEGKLAGTIPVSWDPLTGLAIRDGTLAASGPGVVRYGSDQTPAPLRESGEQVSLMLQALRNFHYRSLRLGLNGRQGADHAVTIALEGANPELYDGYPFKFNVALSGPLDKIVQSGMQSFTLSDRVRDLVRERAERGVSR